VRIASTDALTLEVHASLVMRLDAAAQVVPDSGPEADDEDAVEAAPVALAIDVEEPAAETAPS
jgi:exoribonuclease-2